MKIKGNKISKEMLSKAMACDTPEELVKLAQENGVEDEASGRRQMLL